MIVNWKCGKRRQQGKVSFGIEMYDVSEKGARRYDHIRTEFWHILFRA